MQWIVSDRGAHFTAEVMREISNEAYINCQFVVAYCSWANETVECACKEPIEACKALLSEWKLSEMQWPFFIEYIQSILNQFPCKRLGTSQAWDGNLTRLEAFTGICPSPIIARPTRIIHFKDHKSLSEQKVRASIRVGELPQILKGLHKEVATQSRRRRTERSRSTMQEQMCNLSSS